MAFSRIKRRWFNGVANNGAPSGLSGAVWLQFTQRVKRSQQEAGAQSWLEGPWETDLQPTETEVTTSLGLGVPVCQWT